MSGLGGPLRPRFGPSLPPRAVVGFATAIVAVLLIAFFSWRLLDSRGTAAARVTKTLETITHLQRLLSAVKDAETGQRGYLLTGAEPYLEPYRAAQAGLPQFVVALRESLEDAEQRRRLELVERLTREKMDEMGRTVELRRAGDAQGALEIVRSDVGRLAMERIRSTVGEMAADERERLAQREAEWRDAVATSSTITAVGAALLLLLISLGAAMAARDHRARETQVWLRAGQVGLAERLQGDQRLDVLGTKVLEYLAARLDARVGALYVEEAAGRFRRVAGYAIEPVAANEWLRPGDGLLGEAAKQGRPMRVHDLPAGYLPVSSSLGRADAHEAIIAPASADGAVQAVLELGFFRRVDDSDVELIERIAEPLATAVRASKDRTRLEELLEEIQRQAEELQAQQEELRVNNEELEEQGRALKESQAQLEGQQVELEQTNAQLEEQMGILEQQKDRLAESQGELADKAAELERSNQYKSEFLANMSHELRTPLNSSLILAKLLADNRDGNLSDEQVKFAQTISAAGNDLLVLINDILDLSKIEAGKFDVEPEPVHLARLVEGLARTMAPVARQKQLAFSATVAPATPEQIVTDSARAGQILRNLLSNALKFTEKGEVSLRVAPAPAGGVAFIVRDSGIGIARDQHAVIFEAFRQADGSTHRRYGGTGLGLSISCELARLLGGDIAVESAPNEGSVFTLTLPLVLAAAADDAGAAAEAGAAGAGTEGRRPAGPGAAAAGAVRPPSPDPARRPDGMSTSGHETAAGLAPASERAPPTARVAAASTHGGAPERPVGSVTAAAGPPMRALVGVVDDRDALTPGARLILVIEDDPRFASILRDLAHEMGFECVIAQTAHEGIVAALHHVPSAILLDMNLPDHSGLGVLDQLKRNPKTRHIPVHVASVADYSQEALERGAVGYVIKPVKREELAQALRRLEAKIAQGRRRVLVVEDDRRQRESIAELLGTDDVEIDGVESAGAALDALKTTTYDCMVMDLSLPDLSGYDLLERMAEQDGVAFPPVIVYTGRSLTRDEEQRLRRFSRSIIVKDARSPERLLDEVTLFLHQVESTLPAERQRMLKTARARDAALEGRRILIVEDDVRNIYALSSVLEPKGVKLEIARNGREALEALARGSAPGGQPADLVLMDIMMPEMDGLTAMREIRKRAEWKKLPIIALTAKAMKDDHEKCLAAGANDYIAKPLDVEQLLSLVRVWMPK